MFDDPQKELNRLQDRLLAGTAPRVPEPAEDEDPEAALEEMKSFLQRKEWEDSEREPLAQRFRPENREENFELFDDFPPEPRQAPVSEAKKHKKKKKHTVLRLAVIVLLELAVIAGLLGWWVLWKK